MPTWTVATCRARLSGVWGRASGVTRGVSFFWGVSCSSSPTSDPRPPTPSARGFTLLELSLVVFIIGLLVMIAVPRLGNVGTARLEASARRLAALARYLSGEAALSGRLYRLNYDLDHHAYWVTVSSSALERRAEFFVDPEPLARPVQLPPAITFLDVRLPTTGRVHTGQVYTHFYPHGYTDPTVVHLRGQDDRSMTVTIAPLTGEAGVFEGYVNEFAGR